MREILFRGKRTDNKQWVEGFYALIGEENPSAYIIKSNGHRIRVAHKSISQFTGLTDKNGKKIFEGDIMPVYEQGEEYYYKVVYNGDCFMLAMLDSEQGSYPLSAKNAISEVIGNIHDNPELLKGE